MPAIGERLNIGEFKMSRRAKIVKYHLGKKTPFFCTFLCCNRATSDISRRQPIYHKRIHVQDSLSSVIKVWQIAIAYLLSSSLSNSQTPCCKVGRPLRFRTYKTAPLPLSIVTLTSEGGNGSGNKWICVHSTFAATVSTNLLCQILKRTLPEFLKTISRFRKRKKIS